MFEQATRMKLRYSTSQGVLSTEDLWNVSLEKLNTLAKALNKEIKEAEEENFLAENTVDKETKLKFEIVKYIIHIRLEEKKAAKEKAEKAAEKEKLLKVLEQKQASELEGLSVEEIQQRIENL
jgi:hypothetical protein